MINRSRTEPGNVYVAGVVNCARCGGLHDEIRFVPFNRPPEQATHWAPCPKSGEPILFVVAVSR